MFTTCKSCSASVSDDRETCPHCNTEIVPLHDSMLELASEIGRLQYIEMTLNGDSPEHPTAKDMTELRKVCDETLVRIKQLQDARKSES